MYSILNERIKLDQASERASRERWIRLAIGTGVTIVAFVAFVVGAILYFG